MSRIQRLIAEYPFLCLLMAGFCAMIAPVLISINLLRFGQFLANEWQVPQWVDLALLKLLRACVSPTAKAIGWTTFVSGFVIMNAGLILHVRHRRKHAESSSGTVSESAEQHSSQIKVAEQGHDIAERECDRS